LYNFLCNIPWKRPPRRPKRRWEKKSKIDLRDTGPAGNKTFSICVYDRFCVEVDELSDYETSEHPSNAQGVSIAFFVKYN
jgi:hypothetical protein